MAIKPLMEVLEQRILLSAVTPVCMDCAAPAAATGGSDQFVVLGTLEQTEPPSHIDVAGALYRELNQLGDYGESSGIASPGGQYLIGLVSQAGGDLTVDVDDVSAALDVVLGLYDANGDLLAWADENGPGQGEQLTNALTGPQQMHYVLIIDAAGTETGFFSVSLDGPQQPAVSIELDENGDAQHNDELTVDTEVDYFLVTAPDDATGLLNVTVASTGSLYTVVSLYDADGQLLSRVAAGGPGGAAEMSFAPVSPGEDYYLRIGSWQAQSSGQYELDIDFATGDITPPEVQDVIVAGGITGRSWVDNIQVVFSEDVLAELEDVTLIGQSQGVVGLTEENFNLDGNVLTLSFDGSLADDIYTLQLDSSAGGITDLAGNPLVDNDANPGDGVYSFEFHRLNGDGDGNRTVDGLDLTAVISNWNGTDPDADMDGNGIVDGLDLTAVISNWGNTLDSQAMVLGSLEPADASAGAAADSVASSAVAAARPVAPMYRYTSSLAVLVRVYGKERFQWLGI